MPFAKLPTIGVSIPGLRPSSHQIDHLPVAASKARSVAAR